MNIDSTEYNKVLTAWIAAMPRADLEEALYDNLAGSDRFLDQSDIDMVTADMKTDIARWTK